LADITIDELLVQIKADKTELKSDLIKLDKELKLSGTKAAKGFGSSFKKAFAALGIGIAIKKAFDFANIAKNAARDAEEVSSKFATVFENVGDDAQRTARELSNAFDLADTTAKELLSTTGDLLVGFGFTEKKALELSKSVQELAIDTASFSNFAGGAKGASEALTAALLGNAEQAKALGIIINQNDKAYQAEVKSIMANEGATLIQAKAQVALNIAYRQSSKSVGDYARTRGSLANQERAFQEAQKETLELLGQETLSVYRAIITGLLKLNKQFLTTTGTVSLFGIVLKGVALSATALVGTLILAGQTLGTLGAIIAKIPFSGFSGAMDAMNTGGEQMYETIGILAETMSALLAPADGVNDSISQLTKTLEAMASGKGSPSNLAATTGALTKELTDLEAKQSALIEQGRNLTEAGKRELGVLNDKIKAIKEYKANLLLLTGIIPEITDDDIPEPEAFKGIEKELEGIETVKNAEIDAVDLVAQHRQNLQNEAISGAISGAHSLITLLDFGLGDAGRGFTSELRKALNIAVAIASVVSAIKAIGSFLSFGASSVAGSGAGAIAASASISSGDNITGGLDQINTTLQASELNRNLNPQPSNVVINIDGQEMARTLITPTQDVLKQGVSDVG